MNQEEAFIVKVPVNFGLLKNVIGALIRRRLLVLAFPRSYIEERVYSQASRKVRRATFRGH